MSSDSRLTLKTDRLVLRPLEPADAPRLALLANRIEIASRLATMPHPYGIGDAEAFIASSASLPAEAACFAITLQATGELIGVAGYGPARGRSNGEAEETDFGYWLGLDYWGRGYATEAARAVLAHAFEVSGQAVLTTDYQLGNVASGGVLRKLGFRLVEMRRRHSLASGGDVDTMKVEITKSDWLARRSAHP
jgi:RimJ/RimL family protein N-acetyltransferase